MGINRPIFSSLFSHQPKDILVMQKNPIYRLQDFLKIKIEMDCIVGTSDGAAQTRYYQFIKKTLQFLVLVSVFSSLYSYLSGFQFFFGYNLQLSTLVFPLFARVLDRKYMFLICNGILAFLAKSLKLSSSSSLNHNGGLMNEGGLKKITEMPSTLEEYDNHPPDVRVEEEREEQMAQQEDDYGDMHNDYEEMKIESVILEREECEEDDEREEDNDYEFKENRTLDSISSIEELNDASVSTEELNKKFEEFIKKMKEEIRIEAQQKLSTQ
ncbi:hypothetical protein CASFOL_028651 [Castilleja foliolosa]|uniref:Uncharacterized protein n=1 Tax=Castilleja foliolosa TaxID=1961234 RepID=A0ABD3CCI9_9LAMI